MLERCSATGQKQKAVKSVLSVGLGDKLDTGVGGLRGLNARLLSSKSITFLGPATKSSLNYVHQAVICKRGDCLLASSHGSAIYNILTSQILIHH